MDYSPPGSSVHGFSRQENWSGLRCSPLEDLPDPGIRPKSLCFLHCRQILYHRATREARFPLILLLLLLLLSRFSRVQLCATP